MKKIRILVIEANRLLRDGITLILNEQVDMRVVGVAGTSKDTLLKTSSSTPHVILLDLGLELQKEQPTLIDLIRELNPIAKVIGMGLLPARNDIMEFVEAGASGFILKDSSVTDMLSTIRSVAQGEKVLPASMTSSLFSHIIDLALKKRKGPITNAVRLTKREREIISLISEGLSNKEIGTALHIATHTVKSHVHNIMEKLALHSRLEIAKLANDQQL